MEGVGKATRIFNAWWLLAAALLCGGASAKEAVAFFDTHGVSGTIRFSQSDPSENVTISVKLNGLDFLPNPWHIHKFPVVDGCQASSTAGHFDPFGAGPYESCDFEDCELGDLSNKFAKFSTPEVEVEYEDHTLTMFGELSFVGRSVVIHKENGDRYACATIQYDGEVKVIKATFDGPVIGYVSMTQAVDDPESDTWVMVDLRYADPTAPATNSHMYHVHELEVDWKTGDCMSTLGHYDNIPELVGVPCTTDSEDWDACELGDLSGKHGLIDIPSTGQNKVFYTDTRLPLSGNNSVGGRSIVIHGENSGMDRIDCATTGKVAIATFDMEGVTGYVEFMQASVHDDTRITVHLENLDYQPNPWHVHVFPAAGGCGEDITGGHMNPFHVPTPYDSCDFDDCEVGDLSGKFGKFTTPTVDAVYFDPTLDLHGEHSIVGRSVVIHKADTSRWVCATIEFPTDVYTYVATFNNLYCGSYTFQQSKSDPTSDTSVLIDVRPCEADTPNSEEHMFHVHINPIDESSADRCGSALGHWNPYGVSLEHCSSDINDWYYCEVGDLSGKHAPLDVPSTKSGKIMLTDTNLPLSGGWSILDRSVVIHAENMGAPRDDCATIVNRDTPRSVVAYFDQDGVKGRVQFTQPSADAVVTIDLDLEGLSDGPNMWHIHEFPVDEDCNSAGGHFNPTGWSHFPACNSTGCEAGDLSGRHGTLDNESIAAIYEDSSITLFGRDTFAGRSVVVHRSDGSRLACASLNYPDTVKVVKATFDGDITGTITLTQAVDDPFSETTVFVKLKYSDPNAVTTNNHMYHVHQYPIDWQVDVSCSSAGGHWNPYGVSTEFCSSEYEDWASCEMGDLSGKHGLISLSSAEVTKLFYVDTNLHLSGDYSVGGLSIVVHGAEQDSSRIACATLGKVARAWLLYGWVAFMQPSAFDETRVKVSFSDLPSQPNKWAVQKLPLDYTTERCTGESEGGIYNPYGVPLDYSSCEDQRDCAVGDLSTKLGAFETTTVETTFRDRNLPLFGRDSIIGRSMHVYKSNGEVLACDNIIPYYGITTVKAEFNGEGYHVEGTMTFNQITADPTSDTWGLISVKPLKGTPATTGHLYHVHVSPPEFDKDEETCSSTGAHWNPLGVSSESCSADPEDWSMCEVADLSGKHGPLAIPSTGTDKVFFTDTLLPLTGSLKITGRSITIHGPNGVADRYDCAELELVESDNYDYNGDVGDLDVLTKGEIAGIVIGVVAAVALLGYGCKRFWRKKRQGYSQQSTGFEAA